MGGGASQGHRKKHTMMTKQSLRSLGSSHLTRVGMSGGVFRVPHTPGG